MTEKWELKLQDDFPFMKRDMSADCDKIHNTYQTWGCQCGAGWYNLIHDLCQEISDKYAEANIPIDIVVQQIKEKFAFLRFYYSFADEPMTLHAFDSLMGGGVRFHPSADGENEKRNQLRRDIAAIVEKYEEKSKKICEECGETGITRKDMPWKKTLCETCYQKYLKAVEQRREKRPLSDFLE